MPTLNTTDYFIEDDAYMSSIQKIVDLRQYTEAMAKYFVQINGMTHQLPPSDISDAFENHISLLVSVHHKVVDKVSTIAKYLNYKTVVDTFYTNQNSENNKVNQINNISQNLSPTKRKASNRDVLQNILVKDKNSTFAIVPSKISKSNEVSPTKSILARYKYPLELEPFLLYIRKSE